MEYNTQRRKLIIPEYGRHIQQMVDYCLNIQQKEDRNKFARAIIQVMGDLNPHLRDIPDFQHKLWDQLFIMSEFHLDVDSPYPIPTKEDLFTSPKKMKYPLNETKYRYYGTNVKKMIEVAKNLVDLEKKERLKYAIANQMKKNYLKWNKDQVEDEVIFKHMSELSGGTLEQTDGESLIEVFSSSNNIPNTNKNNKSNNTNNNKNAKNKKKFFKTKR